MGPQPCRAVAALADLGLSDAEIARYFGASPDCIARLRRGGTAPACRAPRRRRAEEPGAQGG
jgi:predicted transcriptional regulator